MSSRSGRAMAWLGGADLTILKAVPQEQTRFIQMAIVLLTTSGIAAISMFFALHDGVQVPLAFAVVAALLWGIVILNLDRFLVVTMQATRHRRRLVLMALPRVLLATVISLTVSTPLVLRVFASDINHQLTITRSQESAQFKQVQANSAQAREASQLLSRINADQAVLAAQARVSALRQQAQADKQAELAAQAAWQCEVEGLTCAGATGQAGNGQQAQLRQAEYQLAADRYNSAAAQLKTAENNLSNAQATAGAQNQTQPDASLDELEKQYAALEAQLRIQDDDEAKASIQNTGILAQLQALSEASRQNTTLSAARYIVLALFFLIGILPVALQFLLNLGPPSAYEVAAKLRDERAIDALRVQRDDIRHLQDRETRVRRDIETDQRRREEDLGQRANQYVADRMQVILDDALRRWSDQVQATMRSSTAGLGSESRGEASTRQTTHLNPAYVLPDADNI